MSGCNGDSGAVRFRRQKRHTDESRRDVQTLFHRRCTIPGRIPRSGEERKRARDFRRRSVDLRDETIYRIWPAIRRAGTSRSFCG